MAKLVVIGALPESLVNFRGELIKELVGAGHEVIAMADHANDGTRAAIEALGVTFRPYPVQRNGMNPFRDLDTFFSLRSTLAQIKPDAVLAYTIKPVIWGGLALRSLGLPARFFCLITGLGLAFQAGGLKRKALTGLVSRLYRWAVAGAEKVIFQNRDNQQEFLDHRIVDKARCLVVSGSGVNVAHFHVSSLPRGEMVFLTIARLLGAKGLREYAEAAKLVKQRYPEVIFNLLGPEDPSPDGISLDEVQAWQDSGVLWYLGATHDVRPFVEQCHVYVLASYHEGMPRTVLEAMSMGRPILTTDVPGCRETVIQGENGYLVAKGSVQELSERMIWLIENRDQLQSMGEVSRRIAEERFDVHKINGVMMKAMALTGGHHGGQ